MTMADNICDCCNVKRESLIGVAASSLAPYSCAWCIECLRHGAEPLWIVRHLISEAADPKDPGDYLLNRIVYHNGEYKPYRSIDGQGQDQKGN